MAKRNGGIIGPANTPTSSVAAGVWRLRDAFNSTKNGTWPLTRSVATNSLRFNSASSDYLNRTFGTATNRKIFTFSLWVKRSALTGNIGYLISAGTDASTDIDEFYFQGTTDYLKFSAYESSVTQFEIATTQVFRDVSAWYHVVVAYDSTQATSSNRIKMYVNGSQITSFSTSTYPTLNFEPLFNSATAHTIARNLTSGSRYFDGYYSEYYFIDGQALTPSSFGASNASGVWYPIAYQGTYGTNGFYLKFANSASLGTDSSGNTNTFTVNNLTSVDQSTDTELNNFATLNPLVNNPSTVGTASEGNLQYLTTNAGYFGSVSTMGVSQGKWYCEIKATAKATVSVFQLGIEGDPNSASYNNYYTGQSSTSYAYYGLTGSTYNNGTPTAYGSAYDVGDIISIAMDLDNNKLYFAKNGTYQNSGVPTSGATGTGAISISASPTSGLYFFSVSDGGSTHTITVQANFGNPPYAANGYTDGAGYGNFSYAVPSGYYALCTKNLNTYG